jgi:hypothetical protein
MIRPGSNRSVHGLPASIADDKRRINTERMAMQRVPDGHQISFTPQDQRGATRRREPDRAERVIDRGHVSATPSEQAGAEIAQGDGARALRDQGCLSDTHLDTGHEYELLSGHAVLA